MVTLQQALTAVAVIVLVCIFIKILKTPLKLIFKLLINTIGGFITLGIVNYLGGFIGISIGVNLVNAIIVAIFGLPGVGFLLLLKWILLI